MQYTKMPKEATMEKSPLFIPTGHARPHNCTRYQGFPCVILLTKSQGWVGRLPLRIVKVFKKFDMKANK